MWWWSLALAGEGVALGPVTVEPSVEVAVEARSNPFLTNEPRAFGGWRVRPGLGLELDARDVEASLDAGTALSALVGTEAGERVVLDGHAAFRLFRRAPVGVVGGVDVVGGSNPALDDLVDRTSGVHSRFTAGVETGEGPVLVDVRAVLALENYKVMGVGGPRSFNFCDRYGVTGRFGGQVSETTWAGVSARMTENRWGSNLLLVDPERDGVLYLPNSRFLDVQAWTEGERGPVQWSLSVGRLFATYDDLEDFGAVPFMPDRPVGVGALVGAASLGWTPVDGHTVSLRLDREVEDVWFTSWMEQASVGLAYEGLVGDVTVGLDGARVWQDFFGQVTRNDILYRADGHVDWVVDPRVTLSARVRARSRRSFQWDDGYLDVGGEVAVVASY